MPTLDELRRHLDHIDDRLIELIADRQRTSREIARVKRSTGHATRDYAREREVILGARKTAESHQVSPDIAEELMRMLIRSSLTTQEKASVVARAHGSGRRALVIGGAGKMGAWFVDFLQSQGFEVDSSDPAGVPDGASDVGDWRALELSHDLVVVATPLGLTNQVLLELATRQLRGVVFDVGSLKSPLRTGLAALQKAGCAVTSVHPMFGPDTELLSGRHVIFVDLGHASALERSRELFAPTMVEQVVMTLDEHDRLIAYVLGLSHALNIAFFTVLSGSGEAAPRLARMSSTTFDAQLDVATRVAQESPDLYFDIQRLNDFGQEPLEALAKAVDAVRKAVVGDDREAFRDLMERGRAYLEDRRSLNAKRA